jgi:UDP-N-acetylmuramyl tripeptide synthase
VALNAKFRADEEWEAAEEAEEEYDRLNFCDDGPNSEEKAAEQRVILASYELVKKAEADAHAREEADEEKLLCVLDVFVQQAPIEEASCRLFADERQCLEDAVER